LKLSWTETGGPHVAAPVQRGFGSRLIERSARDQLGGDATVDFLPRGVVYTVNCSLDPAGAPDSGDIGSPTVGPIAAG
jgi:two-component sensor histidine kinase